MKTISKETAKDFLLRHIRNGFKVNERVMREVEAEGTCFLLKLADKDSFLSLIWQVCDSETWLTPAMADRTLRSVAARLIKANQKYLELSSWFHRCDKIDREFDFGKFGWLVVTPALDSERQHSPHGIFYLYDGNHKAIVLARRLLSGAAYEPVEALCLVPRRN